MDTTREERSDADAYQSAYETAITEGHSVKWSEDYGQRIVESRYLGRLYESFLRQGLSESDAATMTDFAMVVRQKEKRAERRVRAEKHATRGRIGEGQDGRA